MCVSVECYGRRNKSGLALVLPRMIIILDCGRSGDQIRVLVSSSSNLPFPLSYSQVKKTNGNASYMNFQLKLKSHVQECLILSFEQTQVLNIVKTLFSSLTFFTTGNLTHREMSSFFSWNGKPFTSKDVIGRQILTSNKSNLSQDVVSYSKSKRYFDSNNFTDVLLCEMYV